MSLSRKHLILSASGRDLAMLYACDSAEPYKLGASLAHTVPTDCYNLRTMETLIFS